MITLFCLLYGEPITHAFDVKLDEDDPIIRLRDQLKERLKSAFEGVDAPNIEVYKVSIPNGNQDLLQEIYHRLDQNKHDIPELKGRAKVKDTFPDPHDEDIYIIVRHRSKSLPGAPTLLPSRPLAPPLCPCAYGC
jgi:hypothetical protein